MFSIQYAELYLRRWPRVEIRTDSNYAIMALTEYAHTWRANADNEGNWYNSKGKMTLSL